MATRFVQDRMIYTEVITKLVPQDEILNYWFTDSDQCESFFQQVDRNIEKRERAEEKCSSVRNNNNL